MPLEISLTTVKNILTRSSGFLQGCTSHSLQPYRGCSFGAALCGVGCYVQHNRHLLGGRAWGGFLEIRRNAAESYHLNFDRESRWAHRQGMRFSIFCSSVTDPFVPQEFQHRITRSVLEAMLDRPPDELVVQTHSHRAAEYLPIFRELAGRCDFRVQVSIETDMLRLPGLPPHASPITRRFEACAALRAAGIRTVVTVAPLLPIANPVQFFARIAEVADAVVLDHFIEGDGSPTGSRTFRTPLPSAVSQIDPVACTLAYRDEMVAIARQYLPGRVGVNVAGFAGQYQA